MAAPIIFTSLAKGAGTILKNRKVQIFLAVILGIFLLRGGIRKIRAAIRKRKFDNQSTEDPNRVALQFRQAANPSGVNWMINFDGTNEKQFERLARKIKSEKIIKEVSDAYRLKYDETLQERAAKELDNNELQQFEDIIQ